jgi:alanine racemase
MALILHMKHSLTWVEISAENLQSNLQTLKNLAGGALFCPAIKANAYGHGLMECAPLIAGGADWLCVNALYEATELQEIGVKKPIYIMGYVPLHELKEAVERGLRLVAYNAQTLLKLAEICASSGKPAFTHLKLETGNNRQGVLSEDLSAVLEIYKSNPLVKLEGVTTHFANIEDTTDRAYADFQLKNFNEMIAVIESAGLKPVYKHCANTAATLLFPDTHFNMVRAGIGVYGLWPSNETFVSASHLGNKIELKPVLSWKTKIAQVKKVPAGSFIGYGCTYKTSKDTRLAILPVGYYDGYDRKLSNTAYVLIRGARAPLRGRVCMNMIMVDVTDIPQAALEDEVVLLGNQGDEKLSAEQIAKWSGTINYEVTTRINERLKRVVV